MVRGLVRGRRLRVRRGKGTQRRSASQPKGFVTSWNPTPSGSVHSLAVANGVVYLGFFSQMGGQARSNIAAVDATSGALLSWNPGANGSVSSLAVARAGGADRANLAAINVTTGVADSWAPSTDGAVAALAVTADTVYAGGDFATLGDLSRANLGAVSASTGQPTAWNPGRTVP